MSLLRLIRSLLSCTASNSAHSSGSQALPLVVVEPTTFAWHREKLGIAVRELLEKRHEKHHEDKESAEHHGSLRTSRAKSESPAIMACWEALQRFDYEMKTAANKLWLAYFAPDAPKLLRIPHLVTKEIEKSVRPFADILLSYRDRFL